MIENQQPIIVLQGYEIKQTLEGGTLSLHLALENGDGNIDHYTRFLVEFEDFMRGKGFSI